ncbi:DUF3048 domain-containing protein [Candidatus Uhrbacteria bacterium]|nr:DUF3048 domain-containing protein [Candidatus Uhrbacteria bacterium]
MKSKKSAMFPKSKPKVRKRKRVKKRLKKKDLLNPARTRKKNNCRNMIKKKEGKKIQVPSLSQMEGWVKRHWLYLAIGAFIVAVTSVVLLVYAVFGAGDGAAQVETGFQAPTSTQVDDGLAPRWLDGIRVPEEEAKLLPRAVMIENHVDARPLAGIADASLVFEAPVEGGITRLMAVFDASTTVPLIGPVRSARPYYVEWAQALDALYAHVGGSPEALNRIGGLVNFRNLDEMAGESYFWRSKSRPAPHNVFTNSENLAQKADDKNWSAGEFEPWIFIPEEEGFKPGDIHAIFIPFDGSYKVKWVYDTESNSYARYLGGRRDQDNKGSKINAKNILVIQTEQRTLDDVGRLFIRTTGRGKAWYFASGNAKEVVWTREPGEFYTIKTPDGRDVAFLPGNTWIEIASLPKYEPDF